MPYRVCYRPYMLIYTEEEHWRFQNKKEGTDQESIQSSTTPDPKYYKRSWAYFLRFISFFLPSLKVRPQCSSEYSSPTWCKNVDLVIKNSTQNWIWKIKSQKCVLAKLYCNLDITSVNKDSAMGIFFYSLLLLLLLLLLFGLNPYLLNGIS